MDEEARARHERVMELFDDLCDLGADARGIEMALLRDGDPQLAAEVESLLRHDTPANALGCADRLAALALAEDGSADRGGAHLARLAPKRLVGALVGGRYRIEAWIGGGGFGHVYRARDGERVVAIKLLRADTTNSRAEKRFRREYLAVSRLDHPGCVRVLAEGLHDGTRYIVMEYVAGGDLGRLAGAPVRAILPVLERLCDALEYVHRSGIVHRDLKPANVLLEASPAGGVPQPRLADFGIALLLDEAISALSSQGKLVGTLDYVSPEQVMGHAADPRSDLYSLGCMLHELLTGRLPFEGTVFERLTARVEGAAVPQVLAARSDVPPGLLALMGRLLARAPGDRPASANEVREALVALARG